MQAARTEVHGEALLRRRIRSQQDALASAPERSRQRHEGASGLSMATSAMPGSATSRRQFDFYAALDAARRLSRVDDSVLAGGGYSWTSLSCTARRLWTRGSRRVRSSTDQWMTEQVRGARHLVCGFIAVIVAVHLSTTTVAGVVCVHFAVPKDLSVKQRETTRVFRFHGATFPLSGLAAYLLRAKSLSLTGSSR